MSLHVSAASGYVWLHMRPHITSTVELANGLFIFALPLPPILLLLLLLLLYPIERRTRMRTSGRNVHCRWQRVVCSRISFSSFEVRVLNKLGALHRSVMAAESPLFNL